MRKIIVIIIPCLFLSATLLISSCSKSTSSPTVNQTTQSITTTRTIPAPAPAPWSDVTTYTEQADQIKVHLGDEFAIGMFATSSSNFTESNDNTVINLLANQMVKYQISGVNIYGTQWFLFSAIKTGETNITFNYPGGYSKSFGITITES